MKRVWIAILVGGLISFAWSAITHMVLPTGTAGLKILPNEDAVLGPMRESIPEAGLYLFPGIDMHASPSKEEQAAWEAKWRRGPNGLLLYHPTGTDPMPPRLMLLEFLTDIVCAGIAALILAQIAGGRLKRALTVASLGLFAWFAVSASQWIWYAYPGAFILAEAADHVGAWLLSGLVMAGMIRPAGAARRFA